MEHNAFTWVCISQSWYKQNEKHAKCIQANVNNASKCARLGNYKQKRKALGKVNGNMDNVNYQSDIYHDIEMTCNCAVFQHKGYICLHDLAPCHNYKSTRTFLEYKGIFILEWPRNSPAMNPIENVWNIIKKVIGNQIPCKREEMWKRACDLWYWLASNVLKELCN